MKLLYVTTNFHTLTLTFVTREVSELRKLGMDIDLLSLRKATRFATEQPGCDLSGMIYLFPVSKGRLVASTLKCLLTRPSRLFGALGLIFGSSFSSPRIVFKQLYQLMAATTAVDAVAARGVDHIHAHLAQPPGTYAMFLARLLGVGFSFTGHAADLYVDNEGNDVKLREAAGAVAISQYNLNHYRELHPGLARAPIVRCGVDVDEFEFQPRERCGRPMRILAVGRTAEKKGYRYLLEALALLNERGVEWTGHLVGGGPLFDELRARRDALGLDALEMPGAQQQSRVKELLAEADVFVLPCVVAASGDIDGIPVSLMEAMAVGCPVVSTRLSGIPELILDGETGLLAEQKDPVGLADALQRLATEEGLAARLSKAGREHVEREFNAEIEAGKMKDFFDGL